jgi:serine/threonine protein kinase
MCKSQVAIKIVSKETIADVDDIERVYRETFILKTLKHQNIIKIFEVIDTTKAIMLVMEYADGGELFDYIASRGRLPESVHILLYPVYVFLVRVFSFSDFFLHDQEASHVFQQIVAGVDYCHRKKIIHRDLKLENVLMNTDKTIKIADFGLSNTIKFGQKMGTACGTPSYTAPEMVLPFHPLSFPGLFFSHPDLLECVCTQIQNKEYAGASVDIWALGVILFAMVCGFLPFQAKSAPALYKKIVKGSVLLPEYLSKRSFIPFFFQFIFSLSCLVKCVAFLFCLCSACKDIIMNMLNVDPDKRFDLGRIRSHAWLSMDFDEESSTPIILAQIAAAAAANMAHTGDNTVARLLADRITPITVTPPAPAATAASSTVSSNTPSNSGSPSASTCSSPTEEPVEQVEIESADALKPRISLDTDTGANSPIVFGVAARSGAPIQTSASRPRLAPSPQAAAAVPSTGFASGRRHSAVLTRYDSECGSCFCLPPRVLTFFSSFPSDRSLNPFCPLLLPLKRPCLRSLPKPRNPSSRSFPLCAP